MKSKLTSLLLLIMVFIGKAQTQDSISNSRFKDKISYKQFIAPAVLITSVITDEHGS